jgi:hypothetical protein
VRTWCFDIDMHLRTRARGSAPSIGSTNTCGLDREEKGTPEDPGFPQPLVRHAQEARVAAVSNNYVEVVDAGSGRSRGARRIERCYVSFQVTDEAVLATGELRKKSGDDAELVDGRDLCLKGVGRQDSAEASLMATNEALLDIVTIEVVSGYVPECINCIREGPARGGAGNCEQGNYALGGTYIARRYDGECSCGRSRDGSEKVDPLCVVLREGRESSLRATDKASSPVYSEVKAGDGSEWVDAGRHRTGASGHIELCEVALWMAQKTVGLVARVDPRASDDLVITDT